MDEEQLILMIDHEQELDEILGQAEAGGWEALALSDLSVPATRALLSRPIDRRRTRTIGLPHPLGARVSALAHLRTLKALYLFYQEVTDQGALALANLTNLTNLDLTRNQITDHGANALANLSNLTTLYLGGNQITDEGALALAKLTNLSSLYLGYNQITDQGATALASLSNLSTLHLGGNQITDKGALALAKLTNLSSLGLDHNQITDQGARELANLANLTKLDLTANQITGQGALALANLAKLTNLDLTANQITDQGAIALANLANLADLHLSGNQITDRGAIALANLPKLETLFLRKNSIGETGLHGLLDAFCDSPSGSSLQILLLPDSEPHTNHLPHELLRSGDAQAIFAAHRAYRESERNKSLQPLNEAKLLVVGDEAVGKTSLIRYLIDDKPCDPSEGKTHGVALRQQIDVSQWRPAKSPMSLRVWDFGGQQVQRGTHRYFLTERSLYLLVLEERREDDNDKRIQQWMDMIRTHGGASPVLVVVNKSDDGAARLRLDEAALRRAHPSVVGVMRTSCAPGDHARATIQALRQRIAALLATSDQLQEVRQPVPRAWVRVRDAIVAKARQHRKLSIGEFEQLCQAERIEGADTQRALLRLLHDLGVVVAHGLRRESTAVRGVSLLDPNWLTTAIYSLITSNLVLQQGGELGHDQLAALLPAYTNQDHEYVLHMMMDRETGLGLAFPLRTTDGLARYLLPDALPEQEPYSKNWPTSLIFRFKYEHGIPIGLMARFIVEAHTKLTSTRWRNGAILEIQGCAVLVRADPYKVCIDVKVDGNATGAEAPRRVLSVVRAYFEDVHETYANVSVKERVPLPDNTDVDVDYAHLRKLEQQHGAKYRYQPEGADREYTVGELLEGLEREPLRHREREWREHSPLSFYASDHAHVEIHAGQLAATNSGPATATTTIGSGTATTTVNAGSKPSSEPGDKPTGAPPDHPTTATQPKGLPWWQVAAAAAAAAVIIAIVLYVLPHPWKWRIGILTTFAVLVFSAVLWHNPATVYRRLLSLTAVSGIGLAATSLVVKIAFLGSTSSPPAGGAPAEQTGLLVHLENDLPSAFFVAWPIVVAILAWRDHHHQRRP